MDNKHCRHIELTSATSANKNHAIRKNRVPSELVRVQAPIATVWEIVENTAQEVECKHVRLASLTVVAVR